MSGIVVILVQFICDQCKNFSFVGALDVAAERERPIGSPDWKRYVRTVFQLGYPIPYGFVWNILPVFVQERAEHKSIAPELCPLCLLIPQRWIESSPQGTSADLALVVFPILTSEKTGASRHTVGDPIFADILHDDRPAIRAAEHVPKGTESDRGHLLVGARPGNIQPLTIPFSENHSGRPHIAVPGLFLRDDGKAVPAPLLVQLVKKIKLTDTPNNCGKGVWDAFFDFPHPLFCDVGRAEDNAEGF